MAAGDARAPADLKVTGYSGTIADTAGNALAAAGVSEDTGVAIITTAPTVTSLTDVTSTGTADLNAGKSITFTLEASELVNASGAALTLSTGGSAAYTSGSGCARQLTACHLYGGAGGRCEHGGPQGHRL